MGIEKITYPVHDDFFKLDVWNNNIKAIVEQFGTDENRLTAVEKKAGANTTNIGTLSNLTTTEKGSLVGAVNEVKKKASDNTTNIGTLSNLTTTEKGSLVGAVNEVKKKAGANTTNIGTLSNLTTTEKGSLVGAINEMLLSAKHMGLTGRNLENRQITNSFTFKDLVNQTSVTFFTNWTDNTNFPKAYGSGVLIPSHDGGAKIIFYADVIDNDAYFMKVKLSGDRILTTTKCLTGGNNIPTRSVDISWLGSGSIEYNIVNGICHVMINEFTPSKLNNLKNWVDICDLPIDKYGNDYSISCSAVSNNSSVVVNNIRYNHNNHKLQIYKRGSGGFYGTLSYPVAD